MKTGEHTAIHQYLSAVEREASALPAERKQELLADLAEHIEVTLAERGAEDDAAIREVLRELGDPRTIAATALGEAGIPAAAPAPRAARGNIEPWIAPLVLALATPVGLIFDMGLLASVLRIGGIVLLWLTPRFTQSQKTVTTVLTAAVVLVLNLFMVSVDPGGLTPWRIVHGVQVVVPLALSAWLWTASRRRA
ncbi:HAAS signaling domain-containing protein [Streptomyces sp. NPDC048172]|uniref:HAAS signaling domain-containing protein n=1 Tax=Streptomyces sp. NPDC048172 TaxID=3365505 RepID=UPI003719B9B5